MWNKTHIRSSIAVLLISIISIPIYYYMTIDIDDLTEISKCPLCFGKSMCNLLQNNTSLLWIYLFNIFFRSKKLVFFSTCDGVTLVLKRPPKNSLIHFYNVQETEIFQRNTSITGLLKGAFSPGNTTQFKKFVLCPSSENLEILYSPVLKTASIEHKSKDDYMNLVFMMLINIEPLIQQVAKDWAIAEYLGSCGSIYISKYCGQSLTRSFPQLNWTQRSLISMQLLEFALNATFKNPNFSFYFTDLTPDNFAVNFEGEVRLVDLEDVIVVDRTPSDLPPDWNIPHKSLHDDTIDGFAFSHQEICSHYISDLNIYAVCQGILSQKSDLLSGGLLHSPPLHMMNTKNLVNDCISPPEDISRFDLAQAIIDTLHVDR